MLHVNLVYKQSPDSRAIVFKLGPTRLIVQMVLDLVFPLKHTESHFLFLFILVVWPYAALNSLLEESKTRLESNDVQYYSCASPIYALVPGTLGWRKLLIMTKVPCHQSTAEWVKVCSVRGTCSWKGGGKSNLPLPPHCTVRVPLLLSEMVSLVAFQSEDVYASKSWQALFTWEWDRYRMFVLARKFTNTIRATGDQTLQNQSRGASDQIQVSLSTYHIHSLFLTNTQSYSQIPTRPGWAFTNPISNPT